MPQDNPIESCSAVISNGKSSKAINVITSIENCPKTAHKGQYVTLKLIITNKGTKPIYNVLIDEQNIHETIGTLKSGDTKKVTYKEYIFTD